MENTIVSAWKLIPNEHAVDPNDPSSFEPMYVVRHADGSGNLVASDGFRFYVDGRPFDKEPSDHLDDDYWYTITEVDPSEVPVQTR